MSMPRKETATCPKCGKEIEFTVWESINTNMDFAIPDIISGKLFEVNCGNCDFSTHVDYPLLFNDMIHKVMIYYVGQNAQEETIKAVSKMPVNALGYRNRVVTAQAELREKTAIFNDGLDDRIVEIIKVYILEQLQDQLEGQEITEVLFHNGNAEEKPSLELVLDNRVASVELEPEAYRIIEEQFKEDLDKRKDTDCIVDLDWAVDFMNE